MSTGCSRSSGRAQLVQHQNDGAELFLRDRVAADVEVPGQEGRGEAVGAAGGTLDQDGSLDERAAGLVAAKDHGLREPEPLGDVPAEARG